MQLRYSRFILQQYLIKSMNIDQQFEYSILLLRSALNAKTAINIKELKKLQNFLLNVKKERVQLKDSIQKLKFDFSKNVVQYQKILLRYRQKHKRLRNSKQKTPLSKLQSKDQSQLKLIQTPIVDGKVSSMKQGSLQESYFKQITNNSSNGQQLSANKLTELSPIVYLQSFQPLKFKRKQIACIQKRKMISLTTAPPIKLNTWIKTAQDLYTKQEEDIMKQIIEKRQARSHKIQLNKNYQFKLKLQPYPQYSLFVQIWINQYKQYRLHIRNPQLTPYINFGNLFNQFYSEFVDGKQNQLQTLGGYLQQLINRCVPNHYETKYYFFIRNQIEKRLLSLDLYLVYNVEKKVIQFNKSAPKQMQTDSRYHKN